MKIILIGGRGFLGRRAAAALRGVPDAQVLVAGRGGPDLRVDLTDPRTFPALRGADLVVNVSSTHRGPPAALAAFCLDEGLTLLEATSEVKAIHQLLQAHRGRTEASGAVVLGAGLFTGLSNALARSASEAVGGAEEVLLGVSTSPFSGAGEGTIDLMTDLLDTPAVAFQAGKPVTLAPVGPGPRLRFDDEEALTLVTAFPEPLMVHASLGVPGVSMVIAPRPSLLRSSFLALPIWLLRQGWFRALLGLYFRLVRRVLLAEVATRVVVTAVARRQGRSVQHTAVASDGFEVAGLAVAATALALVRLPRPVRGLHLVDELVPLGAMVEGIRALSAGVQLRVEAPRASGEPEASAPGGAGAAEVGEGLA